jgi:hypothetical protein
MKTTRDLAREMEAAKIIRAQLETLAADDEDLARDMIEGETSLVETIAALVAHEGEDKALIAGLSKYEDELDLRKKRIAARIETRRALLGSALEIAGLQKLETPSGTVSLAKVAPRAIVLDEAEIPTRFWKAAAPTLDKKALNDALKAGEEVPGATLSNGSQTIKIGR